jgi:hypothetical protein
MNLKYIINKVERANHPLSLQIHRLANNHEQEPNVFQSCHNSSIEPERIKISLFLNQTNTNMSYDQ